MGNPRHLRPSYISVAASLQYFANWKQNRREDVFCVQVGANDGKINDPVFKYFNTYEWNGLLVEPQTDVFEQLKQNYIHRPNLILENVAIGPSGQSLPFYRLACSRDRWATGLSTFDKDRLVAHINSGYVKRKAEVHGANGDPEAIETIMIPTVSFNDLFAKHGVKKVDLLCIDTEGFDFEVLKQFNFEHFHPQLIIYESKNLSDEDFVASKQLLQKHGYRIFWERGDTIAISFAMPKAIELSYRVMAHWNRLRLYLSKNVFAKRKRA